MNHTDINKNSPALLSDKIFALSTEKAKEILDDILWECLSYEPSGVSGSCQGNYDSYLDGRAATAEEIVEKIRDRTEEMGS